MANPRLLLLLVYSSPWKHIKTKRQDAISQGMDRISNDWL
jgi:hypothetical protein